LLASHLLECLEDRRQREYSRVDQILDLIFGIHGVPHVFLIHQPAHHHIQPVLLHQIHHLQRQVVRVVQQLDRPGLEQHGLELFQGLRYAHHDQIGAHLQQGVGDEVVVFRDCDEVVRQVLLLVLEGDHGAFGEHLGDSSLQGFLGLFALASLSGHPLLHLVWSFELLNHDQLVPPLDKLMRVFLETLLRESHMHLGAHPFQL